MAVVPFRERGRLQDRLQDMQVRPRVDILSARSHLPGMRPLVGGLLTVHVARGLGPPRRLCFNESSLSISLLRF